MSVVLGDKYVMGLGVGDLSGVLDEDLLGYIVCVSVVGLRMVVCFTMV